MGSEKQKKGGKEKEKIALQWILCASTKYKEFNWSQGKEVSSLAAW